MYKYPFLLFILVYTTSAKAQNMDLLIRRSWQQSAHLKSLDFQLQSAEAALREAKAMYGPNVVFGAQYTLANGGRDISIPVGDLLNPVYTSLNQITNSNAFPQISNVEEQFLPDNFYDMRFRVSQPLFYPDLSINKHIKRSQMELKQLESKSFKRLLSREVMQAVFQLRAARHVLEIYQSTDSLLLEAHRTTQSMIRNGVSLPSALSRIASQMATVSAQKMDITAQIGNAKEYLSYLTGIASDSLDYYDIQLNAYPASLEEPQRIREELLQIDKGMEMQQQALKKEKQFYLPRVGAQLDLGSQDFDFGFSPYVLFGLNLEWNLFDTKRHAYRKHMLGSELKSLEARKTEVSEQFELHTRIAKRNLESSVSQARAYEQRIGHAEKLYKEVYLKYKEGSSNYLELIDAQSQLTQTRLQHAISLQNAWMRWSEYVYVRASYPIE